MEFDAYQVIAQTTAVYPEDMKVVYPTLGLTGEAGEVAEKVKKLIRDSDGVITEKFKKDITKELGDVLWYVAAVASDLDISLNEIALANTVKLRLRSQKGTLQGSGDDR